MKFKSDITAVLQIEYILKGFALQQVFKYLEDSLAYGKENDLV